VRKADNFNSISGLFVKKCGILDVSQPPGPEAYDCLGTFRAVTFLSSPKKNRMQPPPSVSLCRAPEGHDVGTCCFLYRLLSSLKACVGARSDVRVTAAPRSSQHTPHSGADIGGRLSGTTRRGAGRVGPTNLCTDFPPVCFLAAKFI
jgi:hypothetical protein